MPINNKVKSLYDALKSDGADVGSEQEFSDWFFKPGAEGYKNRKYVYDTFKADGADVGKNYEEFAGWLGMQAVPAKKAPATAQPLPATSAKTAQPQAVTSSETVKPQVATPVKPVKPQMADTPLSEEDKQQMSSWAGDTVAQAKAGNRRAMNRMDYIMGNAGLQVKPVKLGHNKHVVERKPTAFGEKATYLTESGNELENRAEADIEQNAIDDYRYSMTVEGQIRAAEEESRRLEELMRERMAEIDKERKGGIGGFLREMAQESHSVPSGMIDNNGLDVYRTDERFVQLEAAARKNNLALQTLRDKKNGQMNDFWHSMGSALNNGYTMTDGLSDMNDARALMNAQQHIEAINKKREAGLPLTKEEEAAEAVLRNALTNDVVQGIYGDDYGAWSRAGNMFATSIDLMKDIMLTPGAGGMAKGIATKTAQTLGKGVAKVLGEKTAQNIVTRGILKGTGILLGAHTAGAVVSNTSGIGHTGGELGKNLVGNVTVDDNGNYVVENQDDLIDALVDAERTQIGENGSEMFGEFIPGVGGVVKKGLEKIGLSKISHVLTNIGKKDWYKRYNALLESGGYNGIPGEALEEYEGMLFDALTGNAAETWQQLKDPRTHVDIWLGCATMGALMGGVPMVTQGYHTAQYYRYKHKTDVADRVASFCMTQEKWEPMREQIDGTENGQMADVVMDIMGRDDLSTQEKQAALDYVRCLTKMRGYNIGQANNAGEENDPDLEAMNESYADGYERTDGESMNDAKNRLELRRQQLAEKYGVNFVQALDDNGIDELATIGNSGLYGDEARQDALDYMNAKNIYDGMIQRVRDDIDSQMTQQDALIDAQTKHGTTVVQHATLKIDDRSVHVVDGNIALNDDGTISLQGSDESIIIRDDETGKLEFVSPAAFLSIDEEQDANELKAAARENITQTTAQAAADKIDGVLPMNAGDVYTVNDGGGETQITIVGQATDENGVPVQDQYVVQMADGTQTVFGRQDIQAMADAANMERVAQREANRLTTTEPEEDVPLTEQTAPREYAPDEEIEFRDEEGNTVYGKIVQAPSDDNDNIVWVDYYRTPDRTMPYRSNAMKREEFDALLAENIPQNYNNSAENIPVPKEMPLNEESETVEPMPMIGEGDEAEPDFSQAAPQRAHTYIYNEAGLSNEEANQFVDANKKAADKALNTVQAKKPKMGTSLAKYRKETAEWQQKVDAAQAQADYWKAVKAEQEKVIAAELQARAEHEAAIRDQATAEELARQEEVLRKREEQAQVGSNNVAPTIKGKWDAVPKVEGARNEIVLANGEKVAGRYVMVESGAATPSHNPNAEFAKNEGFPVDENGQSVNDRDYERDQDAQAVTRNIASQYDSRAMQTPVVVSNDGVVLSGNGRTMAGELAAQNGTDAAYIEHLKKYGRQYGFSAEQVEGMQHPRVLFVPDAAMPYTADTFAKFNQQEMKGQSKSEQAVKLGKIVDDDTFNRIIKRINAYDTLGDFYSDTSAATSAMQELLKAGAISQAQYAEMFDGDAISAQGKEMLENMLIGKAFESNPDAVREITAYKSVRQSVISALAEISNNLMLGEEYSLESELAQAIDLVFKARNSGGYKAGERVSSYARQLNLFPFDEGESVADYTNATVLMLADVLNDSRVTRLKKILTIYNHHAQDSANGQMDLFTGGVESKQNILDTVNSILNNGTEEQQALVDAAIAERKRRAEAGAEQRGGDEASEQAPNDAGRSAEIERRAGRDAGRDSQRADNISENEITAPLSEETNEYGKPFVKASNGSTDFGTIDAESGLVEAPIKLSLGENHKDENGKNHGYGLIHIEAGHGDQIRAAGFGSVEEFVESVAKNYTAIREGGIIAGNQTYLLEVLDEHNNTLFVQLSKDGKYWNVNSAGIFKKKYSRRKSKVYDVPALGSGKDTDTTGVNSGHEDGATAPAGNSPKTSDGKDNTSLPNEQISEEENATQPTDAEEKQTLQASIDAAASEVNTEPTPAQAEAGNYKKGHITIGEFDITIENPAGSTRKGVDDDGKEWSTTMANTYGYIKGTEGVDGDHIDVFLHSDMDQWNGRKAFVVDQTNTDGSFDEHKVMLGFNDKDEAMSAYLANYDETWAQTHPGLRISETNIEDFNKWVESSHRKTKPFADYSTVNKVTDDAHVKQLTSKKSHKKFVQGESYRISDGTLITIEEEIDRNTRKIGWTDKDGKKHTGGVSVAELEQVTGKSSANEAVLASSEQQMQGTPKGYKVEPKPYTNKQGKTLDTYLVTFDRNFSKEELSAIRSKVKALKGWYDRESRSWMLRSTDDAKAFAEEIIGKSEDEVADEAPLSLNDMRDASDVSKVDVGGLFDTLNATGEAKQSDHAEQEPVELPKPKSKSKWVDDADANRFEELKRRMRNKLRGQMNMGVDPEILAIGTEMAFYVIKHGARKFGDYAKAMIDELGDAIRPYIKSFYNGARDFPEMEEYADEMTPYDEVRTFDVANFDKAVPDAMETAAQVVVEQEAAQQAEEAKEKLTEQRNEKRKESKGKAGSVSVKEKVAASTPRDADLFGDSAAYQEREAQVVELVEEISKEIESRAGQLELDAETAKPLTMTDVKKMASKHEALKNISDTDLQELVELAMTQLTRSEAIANVDGTFAAQRSAYGRIVNLYKMQPSLNARDSERLLKQQYSTPTPFGYVMGQFVRAGGKTVGSMLEPSAGNGALTITVNPSLVHVNDIDDARLANLRKLGYGQVTAQNALLPFGGDKVDVVLTNPPFGTVTERVYDGVFRVSSLEGQMAINALSKMKDDGRAAIVIGGNTNYRKNGSMNPKDAAFFGYLYSRYNVADVINISGKALYSRNGTGYDVRMILIDGRKTGEFHRVFPPVKSKARAEQVTTFDELYKRVQDDIQQIQQVGNKSAYVQRDPGTAVDRTASASVRSGNNSPDTGARQRPDTTGDTVGSASRSDSGQTASRHDGQRAVEMDNADGRNGTGTDDVQGADGRESGRRKSDNSVDNGRGRSRNDGRDTITPRPDRSAERLEVKPDLNTEKVAYPNQSDNGFTLMSVVPAAQAQVLQKSLSEIGDVDQYLVDELGYSSKDELYSYLAAEQIDSVALAIHQMNRGNAFIIGDMTGVGKGRQGAALIRYAVKQNKVPIYFTQKPTLFTDNYRDLADIGSSDLRPFIIASNPKDANIVDADGNVVYKLPSNKEQKRVFSYIMEHGALPEEYDYVLTTYDQIKNGTSDYSQTGDGTWNVEARKLSQKSKGYTTADYNGQTRRDALARLAEGNITILDESHTVGGDSGCGRYMQMLTSQCDGVTFLSATFAKRADNMPIYAQRTAIAEAGVKASELIEAISKGGVTLQEIMSKQLVESGQMIRRERSFEGVTIDWLSMPEETDRRQRAQFNEVAEIFNSIRNFQDDYITPLIDAKNERAAERGATVGHTQGTKDLGVKNVAFASKMYNLVNQLLFALKVDAVADRVIENLRNGYKPVISFTNTMEGFLKEAPKGEVMDEVPNFSLTLLRALDGVMRYTEKDADENSEGGIIPLSELSPEGRNAYNSIREKIMNLSANLPISPMDAIRMKIEEAGYSVAEITGRTMQLNRTDDGRYIIDTRKDRDKKAAMRDFNSGKLDVLMINKSGSTGISLHASSKFEDQRQRVMVFAQFQSDINDEVQMRGRIDRSGQVTRGRYEYIMSTIPAEQRIQMMFKAKLKSLDANTTSSQKSKFNEMEIVDYLNKYGDDVVWEYMKEHPELEERLGDPLDMLHEKNGESSPRTFQEEDTSKKTDCAGKISRYLAFLSVEEQDDIFREITEAYRVKIQLLDDAGENDLEITTMPLRAETKRKQIWHEGENPGSGNAFADNTYVEEVEVDVLKKPMKRDEISDATRKLMGEQYAEKNGRVDWDNYVHVKRDEISAFYRAKADDAIAKLSESGEARIAKAKEKAVTAATKARARGENNLTDAEIQSLADTVASETRAVEQQKKDKRRSEILGVRDKILSLLNRLRAESIYVVPQDLKQGTPEIVSQTFGTFVGFKFNKGYILGSSTAIFATLDGRRKVELSLNNPAISTIISATETAYRYSGKEIGGITMDNWDSKVPTQTRQKRYIITGNLLQALVDTEKGEKTRGNLISYSTIDGDTRQGILMGENFKLTDLRNSAPLSSRLAQIREGDAVVSEDGDVQISKELYDWRHRGDYELRVPKSTQRGGKYTMHHDLLQLVQGYNFVTKGNNMVAYIDEKNIAKVVDMLSREPFNLTVLQKSQLSDVSVGKANGEDHEDLMREGDGAFSDDDLSLENDPWAKMWGESRRSAKQRAAFAERERRNMEEHVKELAERLHLGNVEIVADASELTGKRAKAKGFYNKKTGKITIVLSNHSSIADIEKTLLHEAVGHYGLRQLFGKQFDTFLDNVFASADEYVRRQIVELAKKHGWDFRTATEEYLAGLAEYTDFENIDMKWWSKIKQWFFELLHDIGFSGYSDFGMKLSDNELRYILWRSYENLAEPGRYRSILGEAADVAMQDQLKVGDYETDVTTEEDKAADGNVSDDGLLFRTVSDRDRVTARDEYERMMKSGRNQFVEAFQDSMLGLKLLYQSILGKNTRIEEVAGYENAYLYENRMSSTNAGEQSEYFTKYMKPLLTEINNIIRRSGARSKSDIEVERRALTDYMMAKHGLERNLVMAEREAREAEANGANYADAYAACREKDYSGLTALTGEDDSAAAEAAAQKMVDDYEQAFNTDALWDAVNNATKATLYKMYIGGMLSKESYENIRDMYQNYIPLRGWAETTSDEAYGYLTSKNGPLGGSIMKRAEGRRSLADDPIATIAMMADDGIRQSNRNIMKQRFLNFALNHPSDAVSVSDLWLRYDDVSEEWVPVFPDINENDSPEDVELAVKQFDEDMEQLSEQSPDRYKRGKDASNIPYKVVKNNLREHQVLVKRNGRTYVLTINGNPRAAQALNGLTNPDVETGGVVGNILKGAEYVNRQLSAFYTTRNPNFVAGNFLRDMLYSNCMTWVKESPRYALKYHKNFGLNNPVVIRKLLKKWTDGTLDMNKREEHMFYQFMKNGGETGYTNVRDIEGHKKAVAEELKKQNAGVGRTAWNALGEQLDMLNRAVENCARFAAFVTSMEMGRSLDRSIYDAKEVSVNFNKKGSGGKMVNATGQTKAGKAGAYLSGGARLLYIFWNAGVQGMTNFGKNVGRHPVKAGIGASVMFALGYTIPLLAQMMGGGDGDDDDKNAYYNLPEYVRRSNICFRAGNQWITIPLPIEFRAIYGMGELGSGVISGNERYSNEELAKQVASQVSQMMPLDALEGGGGISPFIPSYFKPLTEAYVMNKGWTGQPIYKDTPFNKTDPEWTKAYQNADQTLVGIMRWLNEVSGGDDYKKGKIDINPAKIEYMLNGYFGGFFTFPMQIKKSGETLLGDREFEWRNIPIANRVLKSGDDRTEYRKLQNEYFKYEREAEATGNLFRKYENAGDNGVMEYAEKADFIYNSPEYLRYEIFEEYKPDMDAFKEELKGEPDEEKRKAIEKERYELMRELVDHLNNPEKYIDDLVKTGAITASEAKKEKARLK